MIPKLLVGGLEENLITLLCYSDISSPIIRMKTSPEIYSTQAYQHIAKAAFDYIDTYREPPRDHIIDLLEPYIKSDSPIGRLLISTLSNMKSLFITSNEDFVINELERFLKARHIQKSIEEATLKLSQGDLDGAEESMKATVSSESMSPGILFNDVSESLSFLKEKEEDFFYTGIQHLDDEGITPHRKQLFLIMAPTGRGKTWSLVHFGKMGIMYGKKVLHITLEMDESEIAQRYAQSFFSIVSNHTVGVHLVGKTHSVAIPKFVLDGNGEFMDVSSDRYDRLVVSADNESEIRKKMERLKTRAPLRIKEFPSGSLTVQQLSSYLDFLENTQSFKPDVLLLDYPDIMGRPGRDEKRSEIGDLYVQLRGIASKRNIYLITATQSNREGMKGSLVKGIHSAEDISKIATSDYVITLNQTDNEKSIGLCRIYIDKARYSKSGFQIIITQNYGIGQFCLESLAKTSTYDRFCRGNVSEDSVDESPNTL